MADEWAAIARVLGPARAAEVEGSAAEIWKKLDAGGSWSVLTMELGDKSLKAVLGVFLREHYGEALRAKITTGEWDGLKSAQVEISELMIARIDGGQIHPGLVLHEGLEKVEDIRVAPGDRAVAFTTDSAPDNDKECRLLAARVDAAGATIVADRTAAYPDWTPDGCSLAYFQAAEGGAKDDLRLATLVRRAVLDEQGAIGVQKDAEDLAGAMFSKTARVRCLRDGRILFNGVEFTLPIATKDADVERERLFVLDPSRQATLARVIPRGEEEKMPKNLTFFELSPDEKRLVVGGYEGEVSVLTIATGEVGQWQNAGEYNLMAAPVWRGNDEITYARRNPAVKGKEPPRKAEIVLQKVSAGKGDHETVLSRDWSVDDARKRLQRFEQEIGPAGDPAARGAVSAANFALYSAGAAATLARLCSIQSSSAKRRTWSARRLPRNILRWISTRCWRSTRSGGRSSPRWRRCARGRSRPTTRWRR